MSKFKLIVFFRTSYELFLVVLQFLIILLHFIHWEFIPNKQIIQANQLSIFLGFLIIMIALFIMLMSIKDLGRNLSPFPRPITNGNLITSGIYRFIRHPMYYSLILLSFGVFTTKLSIYYLSLTISLALILKFKIILEEQYLNIKFKNYFIYKKKIKY